MTRVVRPLPWPAEHRWPVTIGHGGVWLTPYRVADADAVALLRYENAAWLAPWDATSPLPHPAPITPRQHARRAGQSARDGTSLPWLVRYGEDAGAPIVGQCTVSNIVYGSAWLASIGYWIARPYAGRNIISKAVALAVDYAMVVVGLHRVEVCIRPENLASLRVVEKLGFREEGGRPSFLHIAGTWANHRIFALTREEIPHGLLGRV